MEVDRVLDILTAWRQELLEKNPLTKEQFFIEIGVKPDEEEKINKWIDRGLHLTL